MEIENKVNPNFNFPSKPEKAENMSVETVKLETNHFPLKFDFERSHVFQYHLKITPEIPEDSRQLRQNIVQACAADLREKLGSDFYNSGLLVFASKKVEKTQNFTCDCNKTKFEVEMNYQQQINLQDLSSDSNDVNKQPALQFLNIFVKSIMQDQKLVEIGRNAQFYYPDDDKSSFNNAVQGTPLSVWTGFKTSVDIYENNSVKLLVDFSSRILRKDSMHQFLMDMYRNRKNKKMIEREVTGRSVLASYGNHRVYKVTGIDFKKDPRSRVEGSEMSFVDYYSKNYGIKIKDKKQPLLIAIQKTSDHQNEKQIFLIPELCKMTGLDRKSRNDTRLMNKIAKYTRLNPETRYKHIQDLITKISAASKNQWGIEIEETNPTVEAYIAKPPRIRIGKKQEVAIKEGTFQVRDELYDHFTLENWAIIYSSYSRNGREKGGTGIKLVDDFAYELRQCGKQLGIKVKKPEILQWNPKNRRMKVSKLVRDFVRKQRTVPEILIFLLDNKESKQYKEIKEVACKKLGILSQVVLKDTIKPRNGGFNKSVISNILKQIAAKLGNKLWIVQRPKGFPPLTMLIGADVYHNTGKAKSSIVGFCASLDKYFTKYASISHVQDLMGQEIVYCMGKLMKKALTAFKKENNALPELIIFFRDGVGESQIQLIMDIEIPEIKKAFASFDDYDPQFCEITVNKRIDDRFFVNQKQNPSPGTIISNGCVSKHHEYFLVAQNVTCGTVTGTKFFVISNNSKLTQDQFWDITYKQCYNYYNWSGAVRVPAPCFYAHKLAYLIGETFSDMPRKEIEGHLYYL